MNRKWIVIGIVLIIAATPLIVIPLYIQIMYIQLNGAELVLIPTMAWLKTIDVRWIVLNVGLLAFTAGIVILVITLTPYNTYTVQSAPQVGHQKLEIKK